MFADYRAAASIIAIATVHYVQAQPKSNDRPYMGLFETCHYFGRTLSRPNVEELSDCFCQPKIRSSIPNKTTTTSTPVNWFICMDKRKPRGNCCGTVLTDLEDEIVVVENVVTIRDFICIHSRSLTEENDSSNDGTISRTRGFRSRLIRGRIFGTAIE